MSEFDTSGAIAVGEATYINTEGNLEKALHEAVMYDRNTRTTDWLQSQVIVIEEGAEPQVGDIVVYRGFAFRVSGMFSNTTGLKCCYFDGDNPNECFVPAHLCAILARVCPIEGKLKAVVYKKGAV